MIVETHHGKLSPELLKLLLLADPNERAIRKYTKDSQILLAVENGTLVGVAVIAFVGNQAELKNIAVRPEDQGRGIGKKLIAQVKENAQQSGMSSVFVGTGNSSLAQLTLYQKCGFKMTNIIPDFFKDYPEPIFENGIRCIDKVILKHAL